jgi:cellulose synthase/poly-beta-1,6-N-acetylglucosamine synthase-like glycosyltransferase
MDQPLSVAVLIPTFRRPEPLARCLRGVAAQSQPADRIIVVVQHDDTATREMLERSTEDLPVQSVLITGGGQVAALNAGLAAATEEVIAITDDDSVPRPDWLARVTAHFAADPGLGGVGGRDWVHRGDHVVVGGTRTVGQLLWYGRFVGFHHLGEGAPREVDTLKGVNMSYRRRALEGLEFDTRLHGGGAEHHNDWAMALAVKRRGWRVLYDPAVAVDHYEVERPAGDPRFATDALVAAQRAHNQTYVAVRYLPPRRALVHVAFAYLVGTTVAPGLGMTAVSLLTLRQSPVVCLTEMARALRARTSGIVEAVTAGPPPS